MSPGHMLFLFSIYIYFSIGEVIYGDFTSQLMIRECLMDWLLQGLYLDIPTVHTIQTNI